MIGAKATPDERARVCAALRKAPDEFVAQEVVRLSHHPTIVGGRIEPRHVDLRVFAFGSGRRTVIPPAPLTRVALEAGSMIVNSSPRMRISRDCAKSTPKVMLANPCSIASSGRSEPRRCTGITTSAALSDVAPN